MQFFSTLFTASSSNSSILPRGLFPPISEDKLSLLQAPCTGEEVSKAFKDSSPHKDPGPDGYHAAFFHKTWPVTGPKVTMMVQHVLEGGELPIGLAEVLLIVFPKIEHLETLTQFDPISLCNVAYKAITILITNRLKDVMGDLIGEAQSSFVPGRQMIDNRYYLPRTYSFYEAQARA